MTISMHCKWIWSDVVVLWNRQSTSQQRFRRMCGSVATGKWLDLHQSPSLTLLVGEDGYNLKNVRKPRKTNKGMETYKIEPLSNICYDMQVSQSSSLGRRDGGWEDLRCFVEQESHGCANCSTIANAGPLPEPATAQPAARLIPGIGCMLDVSVEALRG